jgi:hypothetical protein
VAKVERVSAGGRDRRRRAGLFALGVEVALGSADCECEELGSGYLMMFGISSYVAGGPAMHHHHRRYGAMVGSGALRLGLPLAAGLIAHQRDADRGATATAVFAGAGLAMVLDGALLAHDRHRPSPAPPAAALFVAPTTGGATAGLASTF